MNKPKASLSGYLPGKDRSSLMTIVEDAFDAFEAALDEGDESGVSTRYMVVGMLNVESVKQHRSFEDKPPTVEFRFERLEVVLAEKDKAATQELMLRIADERGDPPLDGLDDADAEDSGDVGGQPTK